MSLKAIKIYSDAKYPAYSTYKEYETFINSPNDELPVNKQVSRSDNYSVKNSVESTVKADHYASELKLKEKLQFYYVMNKPLKKDDLNKTNETSVTRVSSVSALLIDDNQTSNKSANLSSPIGNNKRKIEDAPDSINQPWQSSDFESPSYLYAPMLGEVTIQYLNLLF